MNTFFTRLKEQSEENPTLMIGIAVGATAAAAKLIDAVSQASSRRAYTKQVNYRVKNKK